MHLYVHVPFCSRRCSYCDFAIAVRREVPVADFVHGIAREMEIRALGGDQLDTVYFGGGTPSKLGATGIADLLGRIRERFTIEPEAEVTLEANPEDVDAETAHAWRNAGVNRVSLGVQTFDVNVLQWMHRTHSAGKSANAVDTLRGEGIDNISIDLIFALPEVLQRDLARDLDSAIALSPNHISAYGLTVEPHTPLGRWSARGEIDEMPEDHWADQFELTHRTLETAGFAHYEVSNYARENRVARHNGAYWQDRKYIGLGPSAHGFDGRERRWNEAVYTHWLEKLGAGQDPVGGSESLSNEQRIAERVYLGLRTTAGLEISASDDPIVTPWLAAGWAEVNERHGSRILSLTIAGWMRLDALASALTNSRSR